jgi:heme/copper-type cytochrome/quinol oxidase subunit 3
VFGLGTAITLVNIFWSHRHGRPAGNDPWQADTLEWSTTSPPPEHNFTTMPFVRSRHPLWDEKESLGAPPSLVPATMGADGALAREAAITGGLDAAPESAMEVPPPTALPCLLALALALFFVGLLVSAALVAWVAALLGVTALARWAWRTEPMSAPALADSSAEAGTQTTASWGIVLVIVTEAMIFAALLSAYFFVRSASPDWPQGGIAPPDLARISVFTVLLLGSSVPLFFGEAAIRRGHVGRLRIALLVSFAMGLAFLLNQAFEFASLDFGATDNAYASLFIVITGLHGLHLLVGLAISAVVQVKARLGAFDADRHRTVSVFSMYWHFVDVVWIFVFTSLYLSVHVR